MKTYPYVPYKGGSGPDTEQRVNNTLHLNNRLKMNGIKTKLDYEYMKELCGFEEVQVKIVRPVDNMTLIVGYDRWGYCADGTDETPYLDQEGLEETVRIITAWYLELVD